MAVFFKRTMALFLSVSHFALGCPAYATEIPSIARRNLPGIQVEFSIPEELGTLEEFHAAECPEPAPETGCSQKTVIYIQDAHDSLEAQENIAGLIHWLVAKYGVKTVLEEGYEGAVPTDKYFGVITDPQVRQKVAYFLMDKLRLGGAEYAHITRFNDVSGRPSIGARKKESSLRVTRDERLNFNLMGADSLLLHRQNIESYQVSEKNRKATQEDLQALDGEIRQMAQRYFSREIKEWMGLREKFDRQELDLLDYLRRTQSLLLKGIGFEEFRAACPNISLLLSAAETNDERLLRQLKTSVHYKTLFEEINKLEDHYADVHLALRKEADSLLPSVSMEQRDRAIFDYYKLIQLLKRLNAMEVTEEEYTAVKETLEVVDTTQIATFIARESGHSVVLSKRWEQNIQSSIQFYEIARERDGSIQSRLKDYAASDDPAPVVLVYGGFHKARVKELLQQNGFSYAVVSPKITAVSRKHQVYYRQLMNMGYTQTALPRLVAVATTPPRFLDLAALSAKSELRMRKQLDFLTGIAQKDTSRNLTDAVGAMDLALAQLGDSLERPASSAQKRKISTKAFSRSEVRSQTPELFGDQEEWDGIRQFVAAVNPRRGDQAVVIGTGEDPMPGIYLAMNGVHVRSVEIADDNAASTMEHELANEAAKRIREMGGEYEIKKPQDYLDLKLPEASQKIITATNFFDDPSVADPERILDKIFYEISKESGLILTSFLYRSPNYNVEWIRRRALEKGLVVEEIKNIPYPDTGAALGWPSSKYLILKVISKGRGSDSSGKQNAENSNKWRPGQRKIRSEVRSGPMGELSLDIKPVMPIWYFLKAFGFDPEFVRSEPDSHNPEWGRVKLSQDTQARKNARQSALRVMISETWLYSKGYRPDIEAMIADETAGSFDGFYLLTHQGKPAAFVWPLPGKKVVVYYPFLEPNNGDFFKVAPTQKNHGENLREQIGQYVRSRHAGVVLNVLENPYYDDSPVAAPTLHVGSEPQQGLSFPSVYIPAEHSTETLYSVLDQINFVDRRVVEIGAGNGRLLVAAVQRGALEAVGYETSALGAQNTLAWAALNGVSKVRTVIDSVEGDYASAAIYLFNSPNIVTGQAASEGSFDSQTYEQARLSNITISQADFVAVMKKIARSMQPDSLLYLRVETSQKILQDTLLGTGLTLYGKLDSPLPARQQQGFVYELGRSDRPQDKAELPVVRSEVRVYQEFKTLLGTKRAKMAFASELKKMARDLWRAYAQDESDFELASYFMEKSLVLNALAERVRSTEIDFSKLGEDGRILPIKVALFLNDASDIFYRDGIPEITMTEWGDLIPGYARKMPHAAHFFELMEIYAKGDFGDRQYHEESSAETSLQDGLPASPFSLRIHHDEPSILSALYPPEVQVYEELKNVLGNMRVKWLFALELKSMAKVLMRRYVGFETDAERVWHLQTMADHLTDLSKYIYDPNIDFAKWDAKGDSLSKSIFTFLRDVGNAFFTYGQPQITRAEWGELIPEYEKKMPHAARFFELMEIYAKKNLSGGPRSEVRTGEASVRRPVFSVQVTLERFRQKLLNLSRLAVSSEDDKPLFEVLKVVLRRNFGQDLLNKRFELQEILAHVQKILVQINHQRLQALQTLHFLLYGYQTLAKNPELTAQVFQDYREFAVAGEAGMGAVIFNHGRTLSGALGDVNSFFYNFKLIKNEMVGRLGPRAAGQRGAFLNDRHLPLVSSAFSRWVALFSRSEMRTNANEEGASHLLGNVSAGADEADERETERGLIQELKNWVEAPRAVKYRYGEAPPVSILEQGGVVLDLATTEITGKHLMLRGLKGRAGTGMEAPELRVSMGNSGYTEEALSCCTAAMPVLGSQTMENHTRLWHLETGAGFFGVGLNDTMFLARLYDLISDKMAWGQPRVLFMDIREDVLFTGPGGSDLPQSLADKLRPYGISLAVFIRPRESVAALLTNDQGVGYYVDAPNVEAVIFKRMGNPQFVEPVFSGVRQSRGMTWRRLHSAVEKRGGLLRVDFTTPFGEHQDAAAWQPTVEGYGVRFASLSDELADVLAERKINQLTAGEFKTVFSTVHSLYEMNFVLLVLEYFGNRFHLFETDQQFSRIYDTLFFSTIPANLLFDRKAWRANTDVDYLIKALRQSDHERLFDQIWPELARVLQHHIQKGPGTRKLKVWRPGQDEVRSEVRSRKREAVGEKQDQALATEYERMVSYETAAAIQRRAHESSFRRRFVNPSDPNALREQLETKFGTAVFVRDWIDQQSLNLLGRMSTPPSLMSLDQRIGETYPRQAALGGFQLEGKTPEETAVDFLFRVVQNRIVLELRNAESHRALAEETGHDFMRRRFNPEGQELLYQLRSGKPVDAIVQEMKSRRSEVRTGDSVHRPSASVQPASSPDIPLTSRHSKIFTGEVSEPRAKKIFWRGFSSLPGLAAGFEEGQAFFETLNVVLGRNFRQDLLNKRSKLIKFMVQIQHQRFQALQVFDFLLYGHQAFAKNPELAAQVFQDDRKFAVAGGVGIGIVIFHHGHTLPGATRTVNLFFNKFKFIKNKNMVLLPAEPLRHGRSGEATRSEVRKKDGRLKLESNPAEFDGNGLAATERGRQIALKVYQRALNEFAWGLARIKEVDGNPVELQPGLLFGSLSKGLARLGIFPRSVSYEQANKNLGVGTLDVPPGVAKWPSDIDLQVNYGFNFLSRVGVHTHIALEKLAKDIYEQTGVVIQHAPVVPRDARKGIAATTIVPNGLIAQYPFGVEADRVSPLIRKSEKRRDVRSEVRRAEAIVPRSSPIVQPKNNQEEQPFLSLQSIVERAGPTRIFVDAAAPAAVPEQTAEELARLAKAGAEVVVYNLKKAQSGKNLVEILRTFPKTFFQSVSGSWSEALAGSEKAPEEMNLVHYSESEAEAKNTAPAWAGKRVVYLAGKSGSAAYGLNQIKALRKMIEASEIKEALLTPLGITDRNGFFFVSEAKSTWMRLQLEAQSIVAFAQAA